MIVVFSVAYYQFSLLIFCVVFLVCKRRWLQRKVQIQTSSRLVQNYLWCCQKTTICRRWYYSYWYTFDSQWRCQETTTQPMVCYVLLFNPQKVYQRLHFVDNTLPIKNQNEEKVYIANVDRKKTENTSYYTTTTSTTTAAAAAAITTAAITTAAITTAAIDTAAINTATTISSYLAAS